MTRWGSNEPDPFEFEQKCEDCGDIASSLWANGSDEVFWTGCERYVPLCDACWTKRDNYDPPDPDGEAFRGGEATAYMQEQQAAARRLK